MRVADEHCGKRSSREPHRGWIAADVEVRPPWEALLAARGEEGASTPHPREVNSGIARGNATEIKFVTCLRLCRQCMVIQPGRWPFGHRVAAIYPGRWPCVKDGPDISLN